jgi:hypothetical protein
MSLPSMLVTYFYSQAPVQLNQAKLLVVLRLLLRLLRPWLLEQATVLYRMVLRRLKHNSRLARDNSKLVRDNSKLVRDNRSLKVSNKMVYMSPSFMLNFCILIRTRSSSSSGTSSHASSNPNTTGYSADCTARL